MKILALTTSTDHGSIALSTSENKLFKKNWTRNKQHSEVLTSHIQKLFKLAKLQPKELDAIAVDRGPGSFTGCRIAVNVAKTMSFALKIPIYCESSLALMATKMASTHRGPIIALLDAHKSLYYIQTFKSDGTRLIESSVSIQALPFERIFKNLSKDLLVVGEISNIGDYSMAIKTPKKKTDNFPSAMTLLTMALQNFDKKNKYQDWPLVEPAYIRNPNVLENIPKK